MDAKIRIQTVSAKKEPLSLTLHDKKRGHNNNSKSGRIYCLQSPQYIALQFTIKK